MYIDKSSEQEILEKLKLDIEIKHQNLSLFSGFSYNKSVITEIRRIDFDPIPLTKQALSEASRQQILKMCSQIIKLANYINTKGLSISLLTLDDIFSCCFLNQDFEIFFGDISFIEVGSDLDKTLFSLGLIVYQLLGGEIMFEQDNVMIIKESQRNIPLFWRQFLFTNWRSFDFKSFFSQLMNKEAAISQSLDEVIALCKRLKAPQWFDMPAKLRLSIEIAEKMKSHHEQG